MTLYWAARLTTSRLGWLGLAPRPPSSRVFLRTGTAKRSPAPSPRIGVDLSFVARDMRPTPLAFVMRGTAKTGSRYSFYLDGTAYDGPWPFPAEWPSAARHLHVGSFAAVERHGQSVVDAMLLASAHATVSFDPNIRPFVTPDRGAIGPLVERHVSHARVVKASEEDLEWLYPGRGLEDSLAAWAKAGPRFCVATMGERGALAMLGQGPHRGSRATGRGRGHRRRGGQLHVGASIGDGSRPRARS